MTSQSIPFIKMHGLGNDFVIINNVSQSVGKHQLPIAKLADRHQGIGFDQLLIIEPSEKADFFCRIFNADGSEAEQCGNGLRCIARFIHEETMHTQLSCKIETRAGIFPLSIKDYDHICVTMGAPFIEEALIELSLTSGPVPMTIVSVGNPHAIVKIDSIDSVLADQWGPEIITHAHFPQGVNVGFMQVLGPRHIRLRTFERGVGETCACGSNACAAVVAGMTNKWLEQQVEVEFRHGSLTIEWEGKSKPIQMTGPATKVFAGVITI